MCGRRRHLWRRVRRSLVAIARWRESSCRRRGCWCGRCICLRRRRRSARSGLLIAWLLSSRMWTCGVRLRSPSWWSASATSFLATVMSRVIGVSLNPAPLLRLSELRRAALRTRRLRARALRVRTRHRHRRGCARSIHAGLACSSTVKPVSAVETIRYRPGKRMNRPGFVSCLLTIEGGGSNAAGEGSSELHEF